MLDHLEDLSIFSELDADELDAIAIFSLERDFDDGEVIITENTKDNFDLYLLVKGSVEVVAHGADKANVSDEVVISKQDKDIFGEIGWLFREERTATVRSYGTSKIIQVNGDSLRVFLEEQPKTGYKLMNHMAKHLARNVTQTSNLLKQVLWVHGI